MKLLIIDDSAVKEITEEELKELKDIDQVRVIEYCRLKVDSNSIKPTQNLFTEEYVRQLLTIQKLNCAKVYSSSQQGKFRDFFKYAKIYSNILNAEEPVIGTIERIFK